MTTTPSFTDRQGQYLAFIHAYTKVMKQPPAMTDIARFFEVTPPTAYNMVVQLERLGFIARAAGAARSIRVVVPHDALPPLR